MLVPLDFIFGNPSKEDLEAFEKAAKLEGEILEQDIKDGKIYVEDNFGNKTLIRSFEEYIESKSRGFFPKKI